MGRESLSLEFWDGFEKQAGLMGQIGAKLTGRGADAKVQLCLTSLPPGQTVGGAGAAHGHNHPG